MLISRNHKVVLVKNKKTASHSMTDALTWSVGRRWHEYGSWHGFPHDAPDYVNLEKGWRTVCFVRCPWDRAISTFEYFKKISRHISLDLSFDEWVLGDYPRFESCYERAKDCTHVYRFENLGEQFKQMLDDCGIPRVHLPLLNTSNRTDWSKYYSRTEVIDRIGEIYKDDVEEYNYGYRSS
jgi:hypothetical protein